MNDPTLPRLLGPDDGDLLGPEGLQDRFLIGAADTGGRLAVVEHRLGPRVLAAPMHIHEREDEFSYVLEGRVGAILDGHEVEAGPGDLLFKPRGQWHTFWNAGESPARILELISPAGLDELFRHLDKLTEEVAPEELAELAARYGCSIDFDATMPVVERHRLQF
jgi:mannose-6-phosphate isomerase-like protein (cupin superfamily)